MASRVSQHVVEVLTRITDANARVSQHVVETLTRTTDATARVSQHVVEVLTVEPGTGQLSQVVAEVLRTGTAVEAQLSQAVLEVLRVNGAESPIAGTDAQLSQVVLEVLSVVPLAQLSQVVLEVLSVVPSAQLSQVVAEVLRQVGVEPVTAARTTQSALEVLTTVAVAARATQSALETLTTTAPQSRVTQSALEVLVLNTGPLSCPEPAWLEYFHDVVLDQYISYGCKCAVKFQTFVVRMREGHEERIGEWQDPLWKFNLTPALRDQADLNYLLKFFRARNGPQFVFKFFNPLDSQVQHEAFGLGDGTTSAFQLSRRYATNLPGDGYYAVRPIFLPALGVQVYDNGVLMDEALYTVCLLGGSVMFRVPPAPGHVLTWSGSYYTPVRFASTQIYTVVEHYERFEDQITLTEERLGITAPIVREDESPDFVDVLFPVRYAQRASMGPEHDVVVVSSDSGGTFRTLQFQEAKIRFTVEETQQPHAVIQTLLAFFMNRKGRLYGFRARDITDCALVDEPLQEADGVKTVFQVVKRYVSGTHTEIRTITKPTSDVVIAVDGVLAAPQPTIDFASGSVTFATPPASGAVVTCRGTFDVPVRFDADEMVFAIEGFTAFSLEAIGMVETPLGLPTFTIDAFAT